MTEGSSRIDPADPVRAHPLLARPQPKFLPKRVILGLASAVLVGGAVWLLLPASRSIGQEQAHAQTSLAAVEPEPSAAPAITPATEAAEMDAAQLDRMRISSQTWSTE